MKYFIYFVFFFVPTFMTSATVFSSHETEESKQNYQKNKILITLNYSNSSITDDDIANSIKEPRPPSITNLIDAIKKNPDYAKIENLDLSGNNITYKGAYDILSFAFYNLPSLRSLNLSYNRIYDQRDEENYKKFEKELIELLKRDKFEELNLKYNSIAHLSWISYLTYKVGEENSQKIKWNN